MGEGYLGKDVQKEEFKVGLKALYSIVFVWVNMFLATWVLFLSYSWVIVPKFNTPNINFWQVMALIFGLRVLLGSEVKNPDEGVDKIFKTTLAKMIFFTLGIIVCIIAR